MSWASVDGLRADDLTVGGWLLTAGIGLGLGTIVASVVGWAAFGWDPIVWIVGAVFLLWIATVAAKDSAKPEEETACDACGERIVVNSRRDPATEVVAVEAAGSPRRFRLGPIEGVLERRRKRWTYCSARCAASDGPNRVVLDEFRAAKQTATEVSEA